MVQATWTKHQSACVGGCQRFTPPHLVVAQLPRNRRVADNAALHWEATCQPVIKTLLNVSFADTRRALSSVCNPRSSYGRPFCASSKVRLTSQHPSFTAGTKALQRTPTTLFLHPLQNTSDSIHLRTMIYNGNSSALGVLFYAPATLDHYHSRPPSQGHQHQRRNRSSLSHHHNNHQHREYPHGGFGYSSTKSPKHYSSPSSSNGYTTTPATTMTAPAKQVYCRRCREMMPETHCNDPFAVHGKLDPSGNHPHVRRENASVGNDKKTPHTPPMSPRLPAVR